MAINISYSFDIVMVYVFLLICLYMTLPTINLFWFYTLEF